eukprot:352399-Chlamydomonas_euryale.AAC.4
MLASSARAAATGRVTSTVQALLHTFTRSTSEAHTGRHPQAGRHARKVASAPCSCTCTGVNVWQGDAFCDCLHVPARHGGAKEGGGAAGCMEVGSGKRRAAAAALSLDPATASARWSVCNNKRAYKRVSSSVAALSDSPRTGRLS